MRLRRIAGFTALVMTVVVGLELGVRHYRAGAGAAVIAALCVMWHEQELADEMRERWRRRARAPHGKEQR